MRPPLRAKPLAVSTRCEAKLSTAVSAKTVATRGSVSAQRSRSATARVATPRRWLAGAQLSLADFAAAAQISVIDYLGALDWSGHEEAHGWYRVMKSRPSFRPLLTEKMDGIPPPAGYSDPNS